MFEDIYGSKKLKATKKKKDPETMDFSFQYKGSYLKGIKDDNTKFGKLMADIVNVVIPYVNNEKDILIFKGMTSYVTGNDSHLKFEFDLVEGDDDE